MNTNLRKQPFCQSDIANQLTPGLLQPNIFKSALLNLEPGELPGFIRTYIEEGTPAAYYGAPILWEGLREWLSARLDISTKSIGLVGSGRTGFSLAPKTYGRPYSPKSDLDFCLIDENLFNLVARDGRQFCALVSSGHLIAQTEGEKVFWPENVRVITNSIRFGFIDANKIPAMHENFPNASRLNNDASILVDRLKATPGFAISRASFRVYESWKCFTSRVLLNLRTIK